MNKENEPIEKGEEPTGRITRARFKALVEAGRICSSKLSFKKDPKRVLQVHSKRAALDENKASVTATVGLQPKRRALLKVVTNVRADCVYIDCINESNIQGTKQTLRDPDEKNKEVVDDIFMGSPSIEEDVKKKLAEDLSKIRMVEAQESSLPLILEERQVAEPMCHDVRESVAADHMPPVQALTMPIGLLSSQKRENYEVCEKVGASKGGVVDIDSNLRDPQICGLYAPDIYNSKRVTELNVRPSTNYMEQLQREITSSMRGILIDWLVEVNQCS